MAWLKYIPRKENKGNILPERKLRIENCNLEKLQLIVQQLGELTEPYYHIAQDVYNKAESLPKTRTSCP